MTPQLKIYYLLQASYWIQQIFVLVLKLEKPRSDYVELCIHVRRLPSTPSRSRPGSTVSRSGSSAGRTRSTSPTSACRSLSRASAMPSAPDDLGSMDLSDTFLAVRLLEVRARR